MGECSERGLQAQEAEQRGWTAKVHPVEVGCRGFVATSTSRLLQELGVRGKAHQQAIKDLSMDAEKGVSGCG